MGRLVAATSLSDIVLMFARLHAFTKTTTSDPTEVKRVPGREYLAARNQAKLTIKRSRHRVVREITAKCPSTSEPPTTPGVAKCRNGLR
jgi:hypothetical protein